jgi:AcrR family transcriptional regulator
MSTSVLHSVDAAEVTAAADGDVLAAVVAAAVVVYRMRALHEVTVELVADEAGLDLPTVQRRFPSIDELLLATVGAWNAQRTAPMLPIAEREGAVAFLRAIVVSNVQDPALMRLLLGTANVAATPGHPAAPVLQQQWVQFHATVQRAFAHDIAIGREPATVEPSDGAEQLIAIYEGLQVQSMLRPNMDLLDSYDRAVVRLRAGWSSASTTPVWEL